MRRIDRILQSWRMKIVQSWVPQGASLLDIGCHEGEFLNLMEERIALGFGIDPLVKGVKAANWITLQLAFKEPLPFRAASFDVIALLATLEHIRETEAVSRECRRLLKVHGLVVLTVPSPNVDVIVDTLVALRIANGMSLEQHYGLRPSEVRCLFRKSGFEEIRWRKFQLGLNNLIVFRKEE